MSDARFSMRVPESAGNVDVGDYFEGDQGTGGGTGFSEGAAATGGCNATLNPKTPSSFSLCWVAMQTPVS